MADDRPLRTALAEYLAVAGLPADSGTSQRWVKVRLLGIPIVFPNFDARRAVLVEHDVHHLLTGYRTDWTGEAEIGAYEIATGCRHLWAAWFFNFGGFLFGLLIAPRRTWRAFVRGRRGANFYGADRERTLQRTVAEARCLLGLDRAVGPATFTDGLAFLGWAVLVVAYGALPIAALAAVLSLP